MCSRKNFVTFVYFSEAGGVKLFTILAKCFFWGALLLMCLMTLAGCGKKGPPVAPQRLKLQAVEDLTAEVAAGCEAVLSWTIPKGGDNDALTGFELFRAEQSLSSLDCPDCPKNFHPWDKIDLSARAEIDSSRNQVSYRVKNDCGFRYFYKIVGVADGGVRGPDSNIVRFELEKPHDQ